MEFIVSSIIGALLGSLSAAGAMVWYLRREDAKKEYESSERRRKAREKEKEELRDYIANAEEALLSHHNAESRLLHNIERLKRDIEEGNGEELDLLDSHVRLMRERTFIGELDRDLKNAKNKLEELEELDREGGR